MENSIRIVVLDFYMASPIPGLDVTYSEFRAAAINQVPVLRCFGSTDNGKKICVHIHGVFPYLYIPYDGSNDVHTLMYQIAAGIDKAVNISLNQASSSTQHVYKISLVSGIPMYGYHPKKHQFLKIYLYNPMLVSTVCTLLLNHSILENVFQPHEAHINFTLQFMIDYNLHGMSKMIVSDMKYRLNVENPYTDIDREKYLPPSVEKITVCELEGDISAENILNRQEILSGKLAVNPGIAALWEDERQRRRNKNQDSQLGEFLDLKNTDFVPTKTHMIFKQGLAERLAVLSTDGSKEKDDLNISVYPAETPHNVNLQNASIIDIHTPSNLELSLDDTVNLDETITPTQDVSLDEDALNFLRLLQEMLAENAARELEEDSILSQTVREDDNVDLNEDFLDLSVPLAEVITPKKDASMRANVSDEESDYFNTTVVPQLDGPLDSADDESDAESLIFKIRARNLVDDVKNGDSSKSKTPENTIEKPKCNRSMPVLDDGYFTRNTPKPGKSTLVVNLENILPVVKLKRLQDLSNLLKTRHSYFLRDSKPGKCVVKKISKERLEEQVRLLRFRVNKLSKRDKILKISKQIRKRDLACKTLLENGLKPKFNVIPGRKWFLAPQHDDSKETLIDKILQQTHNHIDPLLHLFVKTDNNLNYLYSYGGKTDPDIIEVPDNLTEEERKFICKTYCHSDSNSVNKPCKNPKNVNHKIPQQQKGSHVLFINFPDCLKTIEQETPSSESLTILYSEVKQANATLQKHLNNLKSFGFENNFNKQKSCSDISKTLNDIVCLNYAEETRVSEISSGVQFLEISNESASDLDSKKTVLSDVKFEERSENTQVVRNLSLNKPKVVHQLFKDWPNSRCDIVNEVCDISFKFRRLKVCENNYHITPKRMLCPKKRNWFSEGLDIQNFSPIITQTYNNINKNIHTGNNGKRCVNSDYPSLKPNSIIWSPRLILCKIKTENIVDASNGFHARSNVTSNFNTRPGKIFADSGSRINIISDVIISDHSRGLDLEYKTVNNPLKRAKSFSQCSASFIGAGNNSCRLGCGKELLPDLLNTPQIIGDMKSVNHFTWDYPYTKISNESINHNFYLNCDGTVDSSSEDESELKVKKRKVGKRERPLAQYAPLQISVSKSPRVQENCLGAGLDDGLLGSPRNQNFQENKETIKNPITPLNSHISIKRKLNFESVSSLNVTTTEEFLSCTYSPKYVSKVIALSNSSINYKNNEDLKESLNPDKLPKGDRDFEETSSKFDTTNSDSDLFSEDEDLNSSFFKTHPTVSEIYDKDSKYKAKEGCSTIFTPNSALGSVEQKSQQIPSLISSGNSSSDITPYQCFQTHPIVSEIYNKDSKYKAKEDCSTVFTPNIMPDASNSARGAVEPESLQMISSGNSSSDITPYQCFQTHPIVSEIYNKNSKYKAKEGCSTVFTPNIMPDASNSARGAVEPETLQMISSGNSSSDITPYQCFQTHPIVSEIYNKESKYKAKEGCSTVFTPNIMPDASNSARGAVEPESLQMISSGNSSSDITPYQGFQTHPIVSEIYNKDSKYKAKEDCSTVFTPNIIPDASNSARGAVEPESLQMISSGNSSSDITPYQCPQQPNDTSIIEFNTDSMVITPNANVPEVFIKPQCKAPTRMEVVNSLDEYKIAQVQQSEPFYSNIADYTGVVEVGHNVLKIPSKTTAHLSDFDSEFNGLQAYRKLFTENVSKLKWNSNNLKSLKLIHCPQRDVIIVPIKKPPSVKMVKEWMVENSKPKLVPVTPIARVENPKIYIPSSPGNDIDMDLSLSLTPCSPTNSQSMSDVAQTPKSSHNSPDSSPILDHRTKRCRRKFSTSSKHISLRESVLISEEANKSCQITGVSQSNSFGFDKSVQNLQAVRAVIEYQHLTTLVMELHIRTRGDCKPDPDYDSICAIFYSVLNDVPESNLKKSKSKGVFALKCIPINLIGASTSPLLDGISIDCDITYADTEESLIGSFLTLIKYWDPDILAGYEIEMLSWSYLIDRASVLSLNLVPLLARTQINKYGRCKQNSATYEIETAIAGRIVLDVWRIMRHEIALQSYTFESIVYHILHRRVPMYPFKDLTFWWDHRTNLYRHRVVEYYLLRVDTTLELFHKLDFLNRTSELARLFGIQFYEVLSRGSQFRVESMMLRLAKPLNYVPVSPSTAQRAKMKAPEYIALVMEPESKLYNDPVIVLDFQSLYPSIIIAYNYCFTTCIGRVHSLGTDAPVEFGATQLRIPRKIVEKLSKRDLLNYTPCGVGFVKQKVREGILPRMLKEILGTRLMVKNSMKENKEDDVLQKVLHNRQLGLKLIANVTYGYTAANFSGRMCCVEVADSVVSKARETLQRAIAMVDNTAEWGARVVYGDTDSLFVVVPGKTKEAAFDIGKKIAEAVTNDNPDPIKLKLEKVYQPCILQTKKRYVGYMYESPDQKEPVYDAKGIETVRRDGCPAVSKMLKKCLTLLFETKDVSQIKMYILRQFHKIQAGRASIQDLTFAKEYRGASGYKPGACVPALELARKWKTVDKRNEPRSGERVPYIIVNGPPGLPLIRLVRSPRDLLNDISLRPNALYYITKVIIPPINRCLNLIGADLNAWFNQMPRKHTQYLPNSSPVVKSTISQYFVSKICASCSAPSQNGLCEECCQKPDMTTITLTEKLRTWEENYYNTKLICHSCTGSLSEVKCISLDCPVLYRRVQTHNDLQQSTYVRELLSSDIFLENNYFEN